MNTLKLLKFFPRFNLCLILCAFWEYWLNFYQRLWYFRIWFIINLAFITKKWIIIWRKAKKIREIRCLKLTILRVCGGILNNFIWLKIAKIRGVLINLGEIKMLWKMKWFMLVFSSLLKRILNWRMFLKKLWSLKLVCIFYFQRSSMLQLKNVGGIYPIRDY